MIVVTTPTGNIGSQVVKHLLDAGEAVRVIARDPEKLAPEVRERAEVVQGSTDDEAVLFRAFEGAESLFWLVPPSFQDNGDAEYYLRFTRPACHAIQSRGVKAGGGSIRSWTRDTCTGGSGHSRVCHGSGNRKDRRGFSRPLVSRLHGEYAGAARANQASGDVLCSLSA